MADFNARRAVATIDTPWLRQLPWQARFLFRGDADAQLAAAASFGTRLSAERCRALTNGGRATLWLGPDEYLLIAPESEATTLAADLAPALAGYPHSLVDIAHRQIGLELFGTHAEWLLGARCPLPLDLTAFPVDMCTRTVFAKAEVVLWRTAPEIFRLEVARSFGRYVVEMFGEVARELPA